MNIMDKVSKRIIELREEKGETQQELADAIGITRQSLSRYEIAARTINVDVLGALAQHFGVSADYLLGLSDVKSTEQDVKTACAMTGLSEKTILKIKENSLDAATINTLVNSTVKNDIYEDISIISLISNYLFTAEPSVSNEAIHEIAHIALDRKSGLDKENATQFAEEVFNYFTEEKMLNNIKEALKNIWNAISIVYAPHNTD